MAKSHRCSQTQAAESCSQRSCPPSSAKRRGPEISTRPATNHGFLALGNGVNANPSRGWKVFVVGVSPTRITLYRLYAEDESTGNAILRDQFAVGLKLDVVVSCRSGNIHVPAGIPVC